MVKTAAYQGLIPIPLAETPYTMTLPGGSSNRFGFNDRHPSWGVMGLYRVTVSPALVQYYMDYGNGFYNNYNGNLANWLSTQQIGGVLTDLSSQGGAVNYLNFKQRNIDVTKANSNINFGFTGRLVYFGTTNNTGAVYENCEIQTIIPPERKFVTFSVWQLLPDLMALASDGKRYRCINSNAWYSSSVQWQSIANGGVSNIPYGAWNYTIITRSASETTRPALFAQWIPDEFPGTGNVSIIDEFHLSDAGMDAALQSANTTTSNTNIKAIVPTRAGHLLRIALGAASPKGNAADFILIDPAGNNYWVLDLIPVNTAPANVQISNLYSSGKFDENGYFWFVQNNTATTTRTIYNNRLFNFDFVSQIMDINISPVSMPCYDVCQPLSFDEDMKQNGY